MKLVVFGANGPTGRQVTQQALAEGHTVTAVTRRPDTFPLEDRRLHVVRADVLDAAAVERAVAGQDAVISALGVPYSPDPVTVYSEGITHITQAMTKQGVRRLVCVTSTVLFGVEAPGEGFFFRKVLEPFIVRFPGRTVYDDMRRMEEIVRDCDRDWTVIRPAGLFDTTAVSDYQVGDARLPGRFTSRADLANALLRRAVDGGHVRTFIDVRTTEGTPSLLDLLRKEAVGGKKKEAEAGKKKEAVGGKK
ncbi:NAD(P)-dependent oxidoreductase [Streptomyces himalayensis]|uniref:SDR family oxidoreductase n=1 Tax=Streptomyces himalayensis subsp. himalayensis TaxID=2756131 RepID=A0A7W0I8P7_9ACTN|nr:SDR family oxidoreductase [Streptomyces himalayensis]MBA2946520.1 SDR family oxidoreductase [Streptomyces himalayensis subsp. himalayensis]